MVDEFDRLGHTVLGCGRTKEQIQELTVVHPRHDFQEVDVASNSEVEAWAKCLVKRYGPPDFLLNNAAIINLKTPLWEVDDREFSDELNINVKGVVNVLRHFVPAMIGRRRGVIVNFISRWGSTFEKQMAPYCATKWAVVALTQVLAEELRSKRVAAIGLNPGIVKTGMLERYMGGAALLKTSDYPTPAEWAKLAVPFILRLRLKQTGELCDLRGYPKPPTL